MRALLAAYTGLAARGFLAATRQPQLARLAAWRRISTRLARAPFWRNRLPSRLEDAAPTDYEDYRATVEADFASPLGLSSLSGDRVLFWARTSGTSAQPKLFPLTAAYRAEFQQVNPPYLNGLLRRFPAFLTRPVLYFAATAPTERSPAGIDVGAISHFNYRNIPRALRRYYAFPQAVLRDADTFFAWAPLYALATDLSAMIAITPSMVVRFAQTIEENAELYLRALSGAAPLPPGLGLPRVSRQRRALLERALSRRPVDFREIWPALAFVACWKTSTCGLQVPALDPWLRGEIPTVDAIYSASEGWMTVPLDSQRPGGALHPGNHVVEFLPVGQAPSRGLLPSWELEPSRDYEVFLTTSMGLVRYRLHDVVRCTGHLNRSPVLEFRQKAGAMVSLGQARVSEVDLTESVSRAGFSPAARWFFAPDAKATRLVCYLEVPVAGVDTALAAADADLSRRNADYGADRRAGLLQPMCAVVLPGHHAAWGQAVHAQAKPVVLRNEPPGGVS